jgi:hypothetical protein
VEGRGQDGLVGTPAELVAVGEVGDNLESADPRGTEGTEDFDCCTGGQGLIGMKVHWSTFCLSLGAEGIYAAVPRIGIGEAGSSWTSHKSPRREGSRSWRTNGDGADSTSFTCAAVAARHA